MARCSQSDGLGIPNRIHAKPVRRPGSLIAAIIVAFLVVMLVHGMVSNEKFDWPTVWKYLFNEHVLSGIGWTIILTVTSMFIAIVLAVILAVMRQSVNPVLRGVSWFWIWFFSWYPCIYSAGVLGSFLSADTDDLARDSVYRHQFLANEHRTAQ